VPFLVNIRAARPLHDDPSPPRIDELGLWLGEDVVELSLRPLSLRPPPRLAPRRNPFGPCPPLLSGLSTCLRKACSLRLIT